MKKFILVTSILFILFVAFLSFSQTTTGNYFNTNDYYFHLERFKGECFTEHYTEHDCEQYPPLIYYAGFFLPQDETFFLILIGTIIFFIIPYLIYSKTKSMLSLAIYFSSAFLFNILFASLFAQLLATLFLVLILRNDNIVPLDFIYLLLGHMSHASAIYFLSFAIIFKLFRHLDTSGFPAYYFLIQKTALFSSLFKLMPIYFWYAITQLSTRKSIFTILIILASVVISDRILLFIPVILALWLPEILETKSPRFKGVLYIVCFLMLIFQIIVWCPDILQINSFQYNLYISSA